jgi:flagellar protein FlgJ
MSDALISSLQPVAPSMRPRDEHAEVEQTAKQFEALFVGEVFKAMRKTVGGEHDFGHQMYTEMFDEQMSEHIAKSGIGLADALIEELSPSKKNAKDKLETADK